MAGMEEAVGQILSNPQAMQQIFSLAQSLGLSQPQGQPAQPQAPAAPASQAGGFSALPGAGNPEMDAMFRTILEFASKAGGDERQLALFEALKPF